MTPTLKNAWDVFLLFAVPIGGGIPAGVILAKSRGFEWQVMCGLYFLSDVALACVFEPLMKLFIYAGTRVDFIAHFNATMKKMTAHSVARFGINHGPFSLVMIAFGVDPMTGRAVAYAAGHGFFTGWAIAIAGDMIFFTIIMASTLWLNGILGDGTLTAIIIMVAMMVIPALIRRIRAKL
jgi:hypothetical protein